MDMLTPRAVIFGPHTIALPNKCSIFLEQGFLR
jgi:hypothetical protein